MINNPLVSVCIITFNQEQYISKAIESVLMQKTNFPFEIIIGEDHSLDKTKLICDEYSNNIPDKIKLLSSTQNVGVSGNLIRTLKQCRGKYIAILEGDDYWTDPVKLQKQVDFLENYQNFNLCFTDCSLVNEQNELINDSRVPTDIKDKKLNYFDLLYYTPPTLTVMYRNSKWIVEEIDKEDKAYDHILFYIASKKKEVFFMPVSTGAHRLNSTSIYNPLTTINKILDFSIPNLNVLEKLIDPEDKNEKRALAHGYAIAYSRLFLQYADKYLLGKSFTSFMTLFKYDISSSKKMLPVTIVRLIKMHVKKIMKLIRL